MDSKRAEIVQYEQTQLLYKAMPTSVWGTLLGIFFVSLLLWSVIDRALLLSWGGIFIFVTAARAVHAYVYNKIAPGPEDIHRWTWQFIVGGIAAALCWSSVGIWLFPPEQEVYQVILTFMLSVVCAVAITSLSPLRMLVSSFVLIALVPLAIHFFFTDTEISNLMGVMVSIFIMLLLASALRMYRTTLDNISLRLDSLEREEKLRDSQQRLTLHIQRTPLAVIDWNTDFEVTYWNPAAEKLFGYTREEALGRHAASLILPESAREDVDKIWQSLLSNKGGLHNINENITKDGRIIICEWYNTPLINEVGEVIGVASLTHDVSERIRIDQLKSEFVSIVSHELRTPLTSIQGSLGLIMGNMAGEMNSTMRELVEIAKKNSERLLNIVNDILDIQKIESGKLEYDFRTVPLMQLIEHAIEANTGYAMQYGVQLEIVNRLDNACIYADRNRIMQVLNNLISNAVKFSPKGEQVILNVKRCNGRIRVSVTDNGPGIPDEFHTNLFDKFTQVDPSATRGAGGTGLGLNIAKGIIEHHQGVIDFEAKQGQGATFYFELPEASSESQES